MTEDAGPGDYTSFTAALLDELRDRADTQRANQAFTFGQLAPRLRDRVTIELKGGQIPESAGSRPRATAISFSARCGTSCSAIRQSSRRAYSLAMESAARSWETGDPKTVRRLLDEAVPSGTARYPRFEWHYWNRVLTGQPFHPPFTAGVQAAAYSPDGKSIATLDPVLGLQIWRADNAAKVRAYKAPPHKDPGRAYKVPPPTHILKFAYSPNGDIAVSTYAVGCLTRNGSRKWSRRSRSSIPKPSPNESPSWQ